MAPEQVRVLTVNETASKYAEKVESILKEIVLDDPIKNSELRYSIDNSDDSLGKKIKRATEYRIPVILVVGEKDEQAEEVSVRLKDSEAKVKLSELADYLKGMK